MFFQKTKKARDELRSSQPMSDEDFIKAAKVDINNERVAVAIRKVVADSCSIPKEHITPETNFKLILTAMKRGLLDGWDHFDFVFNLERELNARIVLPYDVFSSSQPIDIDSITFKPVFCILLSKIEIKE